MQDGVYHVRFSSGSDSGEGLAVVKANTVNGGDQGYLYTGPITDTNGQIAGQLHVQRWRAGQQSVFGNVQQFDLVLAGQTTANGFSASGSVVGMPTRRIVIEGKRVAAAA